MKKTFLIIISIAFMTVSCHNPKDQNDQKDLSSGINLSNLDTTVVPGNNFYEYACGGWMKKHPLTGEYSRYGNFDVLRENNLKEVQDLVLNIAKKGGKEGSIQQKIGDLYNIAMDSTKLNKQGYEPIEPQLKEIAAIKSKSDLLKLMPKLFLSGVDTYFSLTVAADPTNSNKNLLQTFQSGIGLGERDYYVDNDKHTKYIRDQYKKHIVKMFELVGYSDKYAENSMKAVMDIETKLAKAAYSNVQLRDPKKNYNKMSIESLQKLVPQIDWENYLAALGLSKAKQISVSQKESMIEVGKLIGNEPIKNQISYLQWKVIDGAASYLSDSIEAENFHFYGKVLSGRKVERPRWKKAITVVNGVLGEAVGQMYVKKYFPPEAKKRMLKLVKNLQKTLAERIENLTWMGDSTKAKAIDKLNAFYIKIGYPNKWRDYSKLTIKDDSYYANIMRSNEFDHAWNFSKLGKPVDRDQWLMTPQTVNAYYNPSTNEICFPAGILQPPFFNMKADDAANYGAIGVVIGHEMTHGFDDEGCQYDKYGNLKNWWTPEDKKHFQERAKVMANYFDSLYVAPGVHANGDFTLGENIADYGGLRISYQAFKAATKDHPLGIKDGFTPDQRFFLAYANVWANNIRPQEILVRTKSDPHSLSRWRVNGQMPQIEAWYKAFNVKPGDSLYVPVNKRVSIW